MTPERWRLIQRLYAGAIAREGAERSEWLARECADALVRKDVEALLYQDGEGNIVTGVTTSASSPRAAWVRCISRSVTTDSSSSAPR